MKNQLLLLVLLINTTSIFAQTPHGINYQTVVRDTSGNLLASQAVGTQFILHQTTASGIGVYTETWSSTTSTNGLLNFVFGTGTTTDDFSAIDWSVGPYFLETLIDVTGGTTYISLGTSQLMSVPYALYAKTAQNVSNLNNSIVDVDNDTKIQVEEISDDDIIRFDIAGTEKWRMNGSTLEALNTGESVFIGEGAGVNDDLSNNQNIGIGNNTLNLNTTGTANLALGQSALASNTTGNNNIAFGNFASANNTIGWDNTAIGYSALFVNSVGNQNTAIGTSALQGTSGIGNVGLGYLALFANGSGSYNTAIGHSANVETDALVNATAVGSFAYVSQNNSMVLGSINGVNGAPSSTNVGIGTTTPSASLDVEGTLQYLDGKEAYGKVLTSDATGNASWEIQSNDPTNSIVDIDNDTKIQVDKNLNDDIIRFDTAGSERMVINELGEIGMGTDNPLATLDVRYISPNGAIGRFYNESTSNWAYLSIGNGTTGAGGGSGLMLGYNSSNQALIRNLYNSPMTFWTNNEERIRIDSDGEIGIGTDNPLATLDVVGDIKITDGTEGIGKVLTSNATGKAAWETPSATSALDGDVKQGFQPSDHSGWVLMDGRNVSTLTASQQLVATSLGFTNILPDATDRVLKQKGPVNTIGGTNTTTILQNNLPNYQITGAADTNGVHDHNAYATNAGSHAHTYSGFANSGGSHSHSVSGTIANAGNHGHSVDGGSSSSYIADYGRGTQSATPLVKYTGSGTPSSSVKDDNDANYVSFSVSGQANSAGIHSHSFSGEIGSSVTHGHSYGGNTDGSGSHGHSVDIVDNGGHNHNINLSSGGGDVAVTVENPYLSVNMFVYLGQ
jgi:hypothetical protein